MKLNIYPSHNWPIPFLGIYLRQKKHRPIKGFVQECYYFRTGSNPNVH